MLIRFVSFDPLHIAQLHNLRDVQRVQIPRRSRKLLFLCEVCYTLSFLYAKYVNIDTKITMYTKPHIRLSLFSHDRHEYVDHTRYQNLLPLHQDRMRHPHRTCLELHLIQISASLEQTKDMEVLHSQIHLS